MWIIGVEIVLFFLIAPFCTMFHETGHALAAKWRQADNVVITIGRGAPLWYKSWYGIQIIMRKWIFLSGYVASSKQNSYSTKEKCFIALSGPVFSLLLAAVFWWMNLLLPFRYLFYMLCLFNIWIGFINLIPFKIGQKESDGYTIYKQLCNLKS